ncbi:MAG: HlyD family efflux transporter periplasmic adaptor subunit [Oscillospiraceae bacterium]|nr:HlyD family efflux transporter periplasmic adaptor subunit [Oscillospiraceae bacterium]
MNENNRKREWVKNAAIIFLTVMLILTFFSNTIMNWSLAEVSAQYVGSGTLSEQIRGTAVVETAQLYEVKTADSRVISSVEVKVGDTVEKGQVLFKLEEGDSTQLKEAEDKLEAERVNLSNAETEYEKMLLDSGGGNSLGMLEIRNLEEDIAKDREKLENLDVYDKEYEEAKEKTKAAEKTVKSITSQVSDCDEILTALAADDYTLVSATALAQIEKAQQKVKDYETKKTSIDKEVDELKAEAGGNDPLAVTKKKLEIEKTVDDINAKRNDLNAAYASGDREAAEAYEKELSELEYLLKTLNAEYNDLVQKNSEGSSLSTSLKYKMIEQSNITLNYNNAVSALEKNKSALIKKYTSDKRAAQEKLEEAQEKLEEAQTAEAEAKEKASMSPEDAEKAIEEKERQLEVLKINHSKSGMDIEDKLEAVERQRKLVKECEEEVENLRNNTSGNEITAQVAGVIESLNYVAGETTQADTAAASIQMTEKGYTASITVTAEQAKKVRVGEEAEIQYYWYGDAKATLSAIKADKSNPRNKQLVFSVSGDVTPGSSLQIVMGGEGQRYDLLVPNSAIREDNNGKFVLAVVSKSSPLGNRYIAKRVDIQVVASDDTKSAVQGELMQSDFIISTSTKPISAGEQVRLVDSQ